MIFMATFSFLRFIDCRRLAGLHAGLFLAMLCLSAPTRALAEVREVTGEFLYGPETSERVACEAAEQRAKQEALRQVLGERFSVSEQLACRDGASVTDNTDCVYNRFLWSEIDGDIRRAQRIGEPTTLKTLGSSRCVVRMQVTVHVPALQPDPSFDFQAFLNNIRLRSGESVDFVVRPSSPMHMAVFSWAPAHNKDAILRIFPNNFDANGLLRPGQDNPIPTVEGSRRYSYKVSFPSNVKQDFVDEYLIFVATRNPVTWLDSYDFDRFKARLREISPTEKRVVKHSYRIIN